MGRKSLQALLDNMPDDSQEDIVTKALEQAACLAESMYDKTYWDDPVAGIAAEIRKLKISRGEGLE